MVQVDPSHISVLVSGEIEVFPPKLKELAPGQEWPVDFGKLTQAKRAKCGKSYD